METEVLEVQGPVQRPDSIRQKLGTAAWGHGASTFIANGVPFSFTTGPEVADRVCACAAFLAEVRSSVGIHDVGAGTGYLTRHVIEAVSRRSDGLVKQCHFVASDSSPGMVTTMKEVLSDTSDVRIDARVADALSVDDLLEGGCSLVVMSYLVDAIPPKHVIESAEGLKDLLIQTYVVADAPVVDASVWPPRVLSGETLADVLRTDPASLCPGAVLQVLPLLLEAAVEGQPAESGDAPLANTRADMVSVVGELVDRLEEESIILLTDFGYSNGIGPNDVDPLMTEYGSATCFAVFFDEFVRAAEAAGALCFLDADGPGKTHTLLIYKGDRADAFGKVVSRLTKPKVQPIGIPASDEEIADADAKVRLAIAGDQPVSYADLANLAHLHVFRGKPEVARYYADQCDKHFGRIAAPEQLLLGDLAADDGDLEQALAYYERARGTARTYGSTHLKSAGIFLGSELISEYADAMRAYLYVTDEPMPEHLGWLQGDREGIPVAVRAEYEQLCRAEFEAEDAQP